MNRSRVGSAAGATAPHGGTIRRDTEAAIRERRLRFEVCDLGDRGRPGGSLSIVYVDKLGEERVVILSWDSGGSQLRMAGKILDIPKPKPRARRRAG